MKVFVKNFVRKMTWIFTLFFFIFTQTWAQEKAPTKDSAKETKESESKPLKLESGTVVVDPQVVANTIKQTNIKHLKKLKSSFYNLGDEQKYNELMKSFVEASITLGEKNYQEARKKFEQNQQEMNEQSKNLLAKYKENFSKYYADYSYMVIDMKINGNANDLSNSSYEKMLAIANEHKKNAEDFESRGNHIEAIYSLKTGINQLIKIPYLINKTKNKGLKVNERITKGLLIEEDYIPKEALKDYDDSLYLVHVEREKEREKERENFKKNLQSKLGIEANENKQPENPKTESPSK
jgi:hypothetical protein